MVLHLTTPDNERLLRWFKSEIKRLNIAIELNTPATVDTIRSLDPGTRCVRISTAVPYCATALAST